MFLAGSSRLERLYTARWQAHMRAHGISPAKAGGILRRHRREDRPARLWEELGMLQDAGFSGIDVVRKEHGFAVYCAYRRD